MSSATQGEVTVLLRAIAGGNDDAMEQLFNVVYDDLRRAAAGIVRGERPGHTLQPTALVHEAFVRLVSSNLLEKADNRRFFYGAACRAMRQIMIDYARRRSAEVHGGKFRRTEWDEALAAFDREHIDLEALDEALKKLEQLNPRQHRVVEMRYFGGFSVQEVADVLDISVSSVEKDHKLARTFLLSQMQV